MKIDGVQHRCPLLKKGAKLAVNWRTTLSVIQHQILLILIQNFSPFCKGCLLDVGCGERPYKFVHESLVSASYGIDIHESPHQCDISALACAEYIPFRDGAFDTVLCTEVLEHVDNPDTVLKEIYRVLRNCGHLIVSVPFIYPLHEQPRDYRRYSYFGLLTMLKKNGFHPIAVRAKGGAITTMVVLFFLGLCGFLRVMGRRLLNVEVLGNPMLRLCLVLPQWVYLFCFRVFVGRKLKPEKRTVSKYERAMSIGYVCVARKPGIER